MGRWGKAPYPKTLRCLFPEMLVLSLTAPLLCLGDCVKSPACATLPCFASFGGSAGGLSPIWQHSGGCTKSPACATLPCFASFGGSAGGLSPIWQHSGGCTKSPACARLPCFANFGGSAGGLSPLSRFRPKARSVKFAQSDSHWDPIPNTICPPPRRRSAAHSPRRS